MMRLFWLLLLQIGFNINASEWTWAYRKRFSGSELENLTGKAHVTFAKNGISPFKQLIFSWNAHRPKQGYFTFYVQSRNANTKKWSAWYKMIEWGAAVQRSHLFESAPSEPQYLYVRLEQPAGRWADGFRLRVESHGKAQLDCLRSLSVTTADFSKFKREKPESFTNLASVKINHVPKISQMSLNHEDGKVMCSPIATSMQVGYMNKKLCDPILFAKKSYDYGLGAYGSWPFNVAHAFELCPKRTFRLVRLHGFEDLYNYLSRKIPIVVSVRGYIHDAPQEYKNGHLLIVIGWDQERQCVICHDPAIFGDDNVEHCYHLPDFLRSWERSHRLAYVVD